MRLGPWLAVLALSLVPALAWAKKPNLSLKINIDGTSVLIDGKLRITDAGRRERIHSKPGAHTLRIEMDGYTPFEQEITIAEDEDDVLEVTATLTKGAAAPAPAPAPAPVAKAAPPPEPAPAPKPAPAPAPTPAPAPVAKVAPPPEPAPAPKPAPAPAPVPVAPPPRVAAEPKPIPAPAPAPAPTAPPNLNLQAVRPQLSPGKQAPITVAVLDFDGAADLKIGQAVSETLTAEIRKIDRVTAISFKDLKHLLTVAQYSALKACDKDACYAEAAASAGVDEVVVASEEAEKEGRRLAIRRIDVRTGTLLARGLAPIDDKELGLFDAIGPAVEQTFPGYALRDGLSRGFTAEWIRPRLRKPPPLHRGVFIGTATAAAVAGLGGAFFAVQFKDRQSAYDAAAIQSQTDPIAGSSIKTMGDQLRTDQLLANVLLSTAGVLALSAGIEAIFTDWKGIPQPGAPDVLEDTPPDQLALKLGPTGLKVTFR